MREWRYSPIHPCCSNETWREPLSKSSKINGNGVATPRQQSGHRAVDWTVTTNPKVLVLPGAGERAGPFAGPGIAGGRRFDDAGLAGDELGLHARGVENGDASTS